MALLAELNTGRNNRLHARYARRLSRNFVYSTAGQLASVRAALLEHVFSDPANTGGMPGDTYLATARGRRALEDHLVGYLDAQRHVVLPWLDSCLPLGGSRILQIGLGTGSASVALAEQGADVIGLDTDAASVAMTRDRLRIHRLGADIRSVGIAGCATLFEPESFDLVVFHASLARMDEAGRYRWLQQAWGLVRGGGLLGIMAVPNGPVTGHWQRRGPAPEATSPQRSRGAVPEATDPERSADGQELAAPPQPHPHPADGNGCRREDIEHALGAAGTLHVTSSLAHFWRTRNLALGLRWRLSREGRQARRLMKADSSIHPGYLEPELNLLLRKDWAHELLHARLDTAAADRASWCGQIA